MTCLTPLPLIKKAMASEQSAIKEYAYLLPHIENGNHKRSIKHILNDEKEHLQTLQRIKKEIGL